MGFPILICDDSALARKLVSKSLPENFASQIHTASHGEEALQLLAQHQVALLFLDLTMPIMDGISVLEEIKRKCLEVFVIVVSGDVQPLMKQRVMALGALDFIEKPLDQSKLLSVLHKFGLY
jgi:two-component system chemotaxis response regulator CheY